jgi:hypothetical protein
MEDAIWPVAIHMPVGGLDSAKLFEALLIRPCSVELFDCPRLRVGSVVLPVLGRRGDFGDSVNDGNASGANSFVVGETFWFALLVAGGVEVLMTC